MIGARCRGIYRELAHSPGREADDTEILRATARRLEAEGLTVELKTVEEVDEDGGSVPPLVFAMCERPETLSKLEAWERRGAILVNAPAAIWNTYRDRMLAAFVREGVPFPTSRLVPTSRRAVCAPQEFEGGVWVKRGDVHNTRKGDVVFATDPEGLERSMRGLAARGITSAVLQRHVDGDLVKFYGVGHPGASSAGWFQWFYHRDQRLSNHPFDPERLARIARGAAAALGLEIWGGDAIVTAAGEIFVIDVNAWPSFALYREEAATRIAAYLVARLTREERVGVHE